MQTKFAFRKITFGTFLDSVAKVVGGNFVISLISLVTSVFIARWTTPYDLGMWNLALLVSIYSPVLQLGVFNGLNRQLPYFIGKGEKETSLRMAEVSYAWCLMLMLVSAAATVPFVLVYWWQAQSMKACTALAIGLIITCSWPTLFLTVTYRTSAEFGRLAGKNTLVALISVPLTLLVLAFGYLGLMARALLLAILGVVSLYFKRPLKVLPKWERSMFVQLCKIGVPIWLLGQLGVFFLTLDRIVLADSPLNLGYFSISIQASTFAGMIPTAITMVMYPQMVQKYGESHQALEVWSMARKGALAATALGAVAALCGWLLIPYFIDLLVPAFKPGTRAAQWACLTGLAMGFSVYNNVFNVIRRQDVYLVSLAMGLGVFFSAWYLLVHLIGQAALVAAAQSMLLANLMMAVCATFLSRMACAAHDRRAGRAGEKTAPAWN